MPLFHQGHKHLMPLRCIRLWERIKKMTLLQHCSKNNKIALEFKFTILVDGFNKKPQAQATKNPM